MGKLRLEDASCAICMDNLFDLRDDLDEVLPIATPDCGHVFHEKCLLNWFRSQADAYVVQMSDHGVEASTADAPAECPECRTECFADPETGDPAVHRLFINFTNGDGSMSFAHPSSSQAPPSSPSQRWKSADKDVLGFARRARGLAAELDAQTAESVEEDVKGTLKRAETLRADVVSAKAAEGFKKYIGGLNVALNRLKSRLEDHPLIPTLEGKIAALEAKVVDLERSNVTALNELKQRYTRDMHTLIRAEKARSEKEIKRVESERDVMKRHVEKEKVAMVTFKRAVLEREEANEAKLAEAQRTAARESADREKLVVELNERMKLVKMFQAKAESRKELKRKIEELTAENEALRRKSSGPSSQRSPTKRSEEVVIEAEAAKVRAFESEAFANSEASSSEAANPRRPGPDFNPADLRTKMTKEEIQRYWPGTKCIDDEDDLLVEEPSLDSLLSSMEADRAQKAKRSITARTFSFEDEEPAPRRSTTARTITVDTGTGKRSKPSPAASGSTARPSPFVARNKSSLAAGPSRPRSPTSTSRSSSKYFAQLDDPLASPSRSDSASRSALPSPPTSRPRAHVLVDASSPIAPRVSPSKRPLSRTSRPDDSVIDLVDSSPDTRPARGAPRAPLGPRKEAKRAGSIFDYMGIADERGRIKKGVATGAKVKRRP